MDFDYKDSPPEKQYLDFQEKRFSSQEKLIAYIENENAIKLNNSFKQELLHNIIEMVNILFEEIDSE